MVPSPCGLVQRDTIRSCVPFLSFFHLPWGLQRWGCMVDHHIPFSCPPISFPVGWGVIPRGRASHCAAPGKQPGHQMARHFAHHSGRGGYKKAKETFQMQSVRRACSDLGNGLDQATQKISPPGLGFGGIWTSFQIKLPKGQIMHRK